MPTITAARVITCAPGRNFVTLQITCDDGTTGRLQDKWFGLRMEIPDAGYLPPGAI